MPQLDARPLRRHRIHGDWNYTLHPAGALPERTPDIVRADGSRPPVDTRFLRSADLTGLIAQQLDDLINDLTTSLAHLRENQREHRRGTPRLRAAASGAKDELAPVDRILATSLHLRQLCSQRVLAGLFGVSRTTIGRAALEVRPLLEEHGYTIAPSTARFPSPTDLIAYLNDNNPPPTNTKKAC
jgi:Helix-turn-helix of DDE superfamily endonuclease